MLTDGYTLLITSWENDGDNYKNQILSGLTKEDVNFYKYIASHFTDDGDNNFDLAGNKSNKTKNLRNLYTSALEQFPNTSEAVTKYDGTLPTDEDCDAYDAYWTAIVNDIPVKGTASYSDAARLFDDYVSTLLETILGSNALYYPKHNYFRACEKVNVYHIEKCVDITNEIE